MTKIYGFGCSFMFGLVKEPNGYVGRTGRTHAAETFLEIIANDLGYKWDIRAQPGCSNRDIALFVKSTKFEPDDLVFIMWTGLHRDSLNVAYSGRGHALHASLDSMEKITTYLKGRNLNFLMTSAFQDFKYFDDFHISKKSFKKNFIEYDAYNNSMFDIVTDRFKNPEHDRTALVSHDNHWKAYRDGPPDFSKYLNHPRIAGCLHPNQAGHDYAAEWYKPYVKEKLERMKGKNV